MTAFAMETPGIVAEDGERRFVPCWIAATQNRLECGGNTTLYGPALAPIAIVSWAVAVVSRLCRHYSKTIEICKYPIIQI